MIDSPAVATAALLIHSQAVYSAMEEHAYLQEIETGAEVMIWEGFTTQLWTDLGKPKGSPAYSRVIHALQDMGCARQMQRGARATPSRWALFYAPTQALFRQYLEMYPDGDETKTRVRQYTAMVGADLRHANRKIAQLEGKILQLEKTCGILLAAHNAQQQQAKGATRWQQDDQ